MNGGMMNGDDTMMGGFDDDTMMGGFGDSLFESTAVFDQCGIDVGDMMLKIMSAPGIEELNNDPLPNTSQVRDFLAILADKDEVQCTSSQQKEMETALMSYNSCLGECVMV